MKITASTLQIGKIPAFVNNNIIKNKIQEFDNSKYSNIYGTIMHNTFYKFVNDRNILDEKNAIKYALPKVKKLNYGYVNRMLKTITLYNTNITIEPSNIKEIYKEVKLIKQIDEHIISGRLDKLIVTNANDLYIIDYKTTLKMKDINSYRGQAKIYQYLLEQNGFTWYRNIFFTIHYLDFNILDIIRLDKNIGIIEEIIKDDGR